MSVEERRQAQDHLALFAELASGNGPGLKIASLEESRRESMTRKVGRGLISRDELIDLEESGWRALASTAQAAAEFYERVLDDAALMLLPGGMVLDDRSMIVESMSGQPWSSFRLEDVRVLHPTADVGVVAYGVVACREGFAEYSALISTSYVRRADGWKLTLHQQTPR